MKCESHNGYAIEQQTVINELKGLDDSYLLVNNIKLRALTSKLNDIQLKNLNGDIDHIILGLNGIFVLETINYGCKISCNGDDWHRSFMRWNLPIKNSPSRQVRRNSAVLKNYLANSLDFIRIKTNSFIDSVIVLTKPSVYFESRNTTLTVLKTKELVNYINNANHYRFSSEELKIVAHSIMKAEVNRARAP